MEVVPAIGLLLNVSIPDVGGQPIYERLMPNPSPAPSF